MFKTLLVYYTLNYVSGTSFMKTIVNNCNLMVGRILNSAFEKQINSLGQCIQSVIMLEISDIVAM